MNDIAHNLAHVRDKISAAATRCGRSSEEVMLLAVSKIKPASAIEEAITAGGNDSNLLIVFYVQIMPDDLVMQLHRF